MALNRFRIAPPLVLLALTVVSCAPAVARERVVGGPCEGCEAVFEGMPALAGVKSESRLAPAGEPGEPMRLVGTVTDRAGKLAPGIVVYAYHTDAKGIYPRAARPAGTASARHGKLRGWAKTDANGNYAFVTIRPASYPDSDIPQHVHMHLIEPGRCTYWIDDVVFTDDPFLTPEQRAGHEHGRGGIGTATPKRDAARTWQVRRDIRLGAEIPGYPK